MTAESKLATAAVLVSPKPVRSRRKVKARRRQYRQTLASIKAVYTDEPAVLARRPRAAGPSAHRTLALAVALSALVIVVIWAFVFRSQLNDPTGSARRSAERQEWEQLKNEMSQIFSQAKSNSQQLAATLQNQDQPATLDDSTANALKAELLKQLTADWLTYTNTTYGYALKYPADWQLKESQDGTSFTKEEASIVVIIQPDIPRVPLPDDKIEQVMLDGVPATLYHDHSLKDGAAVDKVITDWPESDNDIYLAGYGEVFDTMVLTFKIVLSP